MLWTELSHHLEHFHKHIVKVPGTGHCFLHALSKSLQVDHKITRCTEKIAKAIRWELDIIFEHYSQWHLGSSREKLRQMLLNTWSTNDILWMLLMFVYRLLQMHWE